MGTKLKKGRKLLLGFAILLLGLQISCGAAVQQEENNDSTAAVQTAEAFAETGKPETVDPGEASDKASDGSVSVGKASKEAAGGSVSAGKALQEEADKTEGALPDAGDPEETASAESSDGELLGRPQKGADISEEGSYTGKEEVSLYLHLYNHLPDNYITKREAKSLGWDSSKGNLWDVAPGKSIGGDHFGNYEGLLPEDEDRDYFECDIDYEGGRRNAKRIIYSDDGLIFYTEDHYESFEQLYGNE